MTLRLLVSMMTFAASVVLANAGVAADQAAGRALAEQWCAKCHNIEKGAPFKLHPPSFASIAIYRDENNIRGKIISPHIGMPEATWVVDAKGLDDLVAYIVSLEAK